MNGLVTKFMSGNCPTRVPSLAQTIRVCKYGGCSLCPNFFSKPAPKPAPKPRAKGDAQGKKKEHVQQFTMRCSLTKKGFISEPVDP